MVSGDPGFYSLLAALTKEFSPDQILVIPGISSFQVAFARIGRFWQDAMLISMHGRQVDKNLLNYAAEKKLGILTDKEHKPSKIATILTENGWPPEAKVWLCANLSYENETIVSLLLKDVDKIDGFEHCVMVVMM